MEKYTAEIQHDVETGKWGVMIRIPAEHGGDHITFYSPQAYLDRFDTEGEAKSFLDHEFVSRGFTDEQIEKLVEFKTIDNRPEPFY